MIQNTTSDGVGPQNVHYVQCQIIHDLNSKNNAENGEKLRIINNITSKTYQNLEDIPKGSNFINAVDTKQIVLEKMDSVLRTTLQL